jgi:acylphosphatase
LRAVVRGRVQGVGFRDFVEARARGLRLVGYVRNGDDGETVEVVAEGPVEVLEQLVEHLREGPLGARVDSVEAEWAKPRGDHHDFEVAF